MTTDNIPKDYDHSNEKKWQKKWNDDQIFKFIGDGTKPRYIIDTPPPYPTGSIHMGHVLNWTYIDMNARYRRLKGFDVMFPQGWDCHGLPTEVKVEEIHNIKKNDVSRADFRQMCVDLTKENIAMMKHQMQSIGFSQDWVREYITMTPKYMERTQYSFLEMFDEDLIYQGIHPVNWCPRCETAIAFAEVEYESNETSLNYVRFKALATNELSEKNDGSGNELSEKNDESGNELSEKNDESITNPETDGVLIATTRPELMSACVAVVVNPDDERYSDMLGTEVEVPLSGQSVKVIADSEVDPEFGTGAVMVCTFGDKTDVTWVNKYDLDIIEAIDEKGIMTEAAGRYKGMSLQECKLATINDLKAEGCMVKQEVVQQNVGKCWRCKTPIEILVKKQWFIAVNKLLGDIKEVTDEIKWIPEHMKSRLLNWADSMEWDWCISRQRIFATPIPVWFCEECGKVHIAKKHELPVDPTQIKPSVIDKDGNKTDYICECGSNSFRGEEDVLDTWMDSSISPLSIAGWPNPEYSKNFPANIRPQGHDIIRTWAFYTILRTKALTGIKPFEEIVINGMVFGEDGYKMSKSRGNVIAPDEVITEYGADALRTWGANSVPGSDVPFDWKDIKYGHKFLRKFWNAFRFISMHLFDRKTNSNNEFINFDNIKENLEPLDKWILSKLNNLNKEVDKSFDVYNFQIAINSIQKFVWHDFCDDYIEAVKYRLYNKEMDEKSVNSKIAAKYTLKTVIETTLKLLTPITPHFADEVYSYLKENKIASDNSIDSIQLTKWPESIEELINKEIEYEGKLAIDLIGEIRRFKSASKIPLNAPITNINIYSSNNKLLNTLKKFIDDIKGTLKINELAIKKDKLDVQEKVVEITPAMDKIGPEFKGEAPKIVSYLTSNNPEEIAKLLETDGKIAIDENIITGEHMNMKKELIGESGKKIDLLNPDDLDLVLEIVK
ncbi:valine--tRNA ligase [Methanobrevibacter cuticularis]|uniref:Valine--tRNA ligase n=1 Tax=Methanobrevibacter cuticularis TaxID=47311 RepID=A0A166EDG7_9EURY|nr:valine--tRNA ligase [Methanobrevibacter cuticularis]KZX16535.1 valine--tRNA ligase [Methanobrevibacter cuticularis]